ncbi:MAG: DUF1178 family protein [Sphingorhabdus sp.]
MISFDLQCEHGHRFEGWFGSHAGYKEQCDGALIACPTCGSGRVSKLLTAPNVGRKANQASLASSVPADQTENAPPASDNAVVSNAAEIPAELTEAMAKLAKAQTEALKDSKWVGREFAEEARAIHYGETEDHVIHGETSADEAEALAEEGIRVAPLLFPCIPPEAKN